MALQLLYLKGGCYLYHTGRHQEYFAKYSNILRTAPTHILKKYLMSPNGNSGEVENNHRESF